MALVEKTFGQIITFSRASSATFFNRSGVLSTATTDSPRFDYDPVTLIPRGILIEEQRTNLLTYSEQFDNAAWTTSAVTVTSNTTTAPDGTSTAETFDDGTANNVHNRAQTITTTTGSTYTLSAFLKNVDRQFAILAVSGGTTSYASAKFNLDAGTLGSTQASGAGWSITSSSITSVGNGWYRCAITFVVGTTAGSSARIGMGTDGTTFTASQRGLELYTGSDKTFFVWGAQLEVGAFSTSYIPTVDSTVTRSADSAAINTLSPWFNSSEGTLFVEGTVVNNIVGTNPRTYAVIGNVGNSDERFSVEARSTGSTRARLFVGGVGTISSVNYNALGTNTKLAGAYGADGVTMCVAGLSPVTTATSVFGTVTSLVLGNIFGQTSTTNINGYLRRVIYYPRRLSNAELQSITA